MIVDFIVTRKEDDPIHYREVVYRHTEVNLIEVPYASTCADARRRSVHIGKSDYVMWFDPDDTLYENTLVRILDYLNNNPGCPGVMCLSDYIDPLGEPRQIKVDRIQHRPVNGHLLKVYRRDVLGRLLKECSDDNVCWQIAACSIMIDIPILQFSGYLWNICPMKLNGGSHTFNKITSREMIAAKEKVNTLLNLSPSRLADLRNRILG